MMTISNSVYTSLKKRGLHNWGFLDLEESDEYDWDDLNPELLLSDYWLEEYKQ